MDDRGPTGVWSTHVMLILMALIWAVNYSVVKFGTRYLAPLSYNGVRIALAAALLVGIALAQRGRGDGEDVARRAAPSRRDALRLLALGALGNGLYQLFFILGVARSRAGTVALVNASSPALIALISLARGAEHVSRRWWIGILAQLLGMACVVLGGAVGAAGEDSALGVALILLGAVCWALYSVLLKPYTARVEGIPLSAYTMVGGALPLVLVALPSIAHTEWTTVPGSVWAAMAYSGAAALVIAYLFWYHGVRTIGPMRTAMYGNLQPLIALAVAWLALGEVPTLWQVLGSVGITGGLLLSRG